jgi:glycerate kinase
MSTGSSSSANRSNRCALVAPDAFKGTYTATQVAEAIAAGLERAGVAALQCPLADGGEGTLDVLLAARGGRTLQARAVDPLGRAIDAAFGLLEDVPLTAVVETARAIGLDKLADSERDPWVASSRGAGELIAAAARAGAERILVAVGGSATVDGGRGAIEILERRRGLRGAELIVLSDVETPWERCAATFGPQKGADPDLVPRLGARLDELADKLPADPRGLPRTGAAGGLSGALWAAYGAHLESGASHVLAACEFESPLRQADSVIVGEGRLDQQSLEGKIVGQVASRARAANVAVHAIVGQDRLGGDAASRLGIGTIREATNLAELERAGAELAAALRAEPAET